MCCPLSAFRAQESSGVPTFLPPFDLLPQIIGRGVLMRAFFVACTKSSLVLIVLRVVCLPAAAHAQQANHSYTAQRPLITEAIDESRLTILKGNTHPLARQEFDLGTADGALPLRRVLLVLKRSDEQESALRKLLDDQQDKNSPSYHKWLTPEKFGEQFGPTDADVQTITSWLQSHGFQVGATKGRTSLEFSGTAAQVQEAFHTTIHAYVVTGQRYWANANDPQIPAALARAVTGIASLNNFPRRSTSLLAGSFTHDNKSGIVQPLNPLFTFLPSYQCSANDYCYAVGPYDFATIYNVQPLWNAGINGTGETIAIVGESNINVQDVASFRSMFGLPVNNPNVILNGPDPGIQPDESEADIDVQWYGAVAPNTTIDFVVSQSTENDTRNRSLRCLYRREQPRRCHERKLRRMRTGVGYRRKPVFQRTMAAGRCSRHYGHGLVRRQRISRLRCL